MDLLTEGRLRDMLALRRVGEATLLRNRDKVPELMNFHRRSDTPLGPPVCLRQADRRFWIRLGSIRASRVVLGALAEQLFLISDLWSLISIAVAEQNAAFAKQSRWSTTSPSGSLRGNGSRRHFRIRLGSARASRVGFGAKTNFR